MPLGERWHFEDGTIDWQALEGAVSALAARVGIDVEVIHASPTQRQFQLRFAADDGPAVWAALLEEPPGDEDELEPPWDGVEYRAHVFADIGDEEAVLSWTTGSGDNRHCVAIVGAFTAKIALALGAVNEDDLPKDPFAVMGWNPHAVLTRK
jgi:hypothetical protein